MPRREHPLAWIYKHIMPDNFIFGAALSHRRMERRRAHYKRIGRGPGLCERKRMQRRALLTYMSVLKNPALRNTKWTTRCYGINWDEVPV